MVELDMIDGKKEDPVQDQLKKIGFKRVGGFFFSCIAARARDMVGQLRGIRKEKVKRELNAGVFTGETDKKQTKQTKATKTMSLTECSKISAGGVKTTNLWNTKILSLAGPATTMRLTK